MKTLKKVCMYLGILFLISSFVISFALIKFSIFSKALDSNISYYIDDSDSSSDQIEVFNGSEDEKDAFTNHSSVSKLHVDGNRILDDNNYQVIFRGFCCGSSTRINTDWPKWYTDQTFDTLKSWGVNIFRLTLKPDQFEENPYYAELLCNYVDICISNDLYVLITWMANKDYLNYEKNAIEFFNYLSKKYSESNNIIYEVCNEPFHSSWNTIYDYADSIIKVIRNNNPNALVVVPTAYHILDNDDFIDPVIDRPLQFNNIIYSYHMYVGNSLHNSTLESLDELLKNDFAILITEWGTTLSNGKDGFFEDNSMIWLDFLEARNIGWINFNLSDVYWNNTQYNSSAVKMGQWNSELNDDILSQSGYFVKHYLIGDLNNTPKTCEMMELKKNYGFWQEDIKNTINKIVFANEGFIPKEYNLTWDYSIVSDSYKVIAYYCSENDENIIYISSVDGELKSPNSMEGFFEDFPNLKYVDFSGIDTSLTINIKRIFNNCPSLEYIEWGNNTFENVQNWSQAFSACKNLENLDISMLKMDRATNINLMFCWCSNLKTIKLPHIPENKIVEKADVFYKCGIYSDSLKIEVTVDNNGFVHNLIKSSTMPNGDYQIIGY